MPVIFFEDLVPKNSSDMLLKLIGVSGVEFNIVVDAEDFSDNNEQPERIASQARDGTVLTLRLGQKPAMRTGSFTVKRYTHGNDLKVALLDVIDGTKSWASETTGATGAPYCEGHVLTMVRTIKGAAVDGGDTVYTYPKTRFTWSEATARDGNSITINWSCPQGYVTVVGPH